MTATRERASSAESPSVKIGCEDLEQLGAGMGTTDAEAIARCAVRNGCSNSALEGCGGHVLKAATTYKGAAVSWDCPRRSCPNSSGAIGEWAAGVVAPPEPEESPSTEAKPDSQARSI